MYTAGCYFRRVCDAKWSPYGLKIASGGDDGKFIVWNAIDFRADFVVRNAHGGRPVQHVAWSGVGDRIFTCGGDDTIRVWAVEEILDPEEQRKEADNKRAARQHMWVESIVHKHKNLRVLCESVWVVNTKITAFAADPIGKQLFYGTDVGEVHILSFQCRRPRRPASEEQPGTHDRPIGFEGLRLMGDTRTGDAEATVMTACRMFEYEKYVFNHPLQPPRPFGVHDQVLMPTTLVCCCFIFRNIVHPKLSVVCPECGQRIRLPTLMVNLAANLEEAIDMFGPLQHYFEVRGSLTSQPGI